MRKIILIMGLFAMACNNSSDKKAGKEDTVKQTVQMPDQPELPDTIFTGFGTEPFWFVYVIKDSRIIFHPADGADIEVPFVAATNPDAVTTAYSSSVNGNTIDLTIFRQDCSDGMSDVTHHYEVTLFINKIKYAGCGRPGK